MSTQEPAPGTGYAQLQRTPSYAVWQPVLGAVALLLAVFVVASLVLGITLLPLAVLVQTAFTGQGFVAAYSDAASLDPVTPAGMLYLNLTLASGTLVAIALTAWVHRLRPGFLTSVAGRVRWRLLGACVGLSVVVLLVSLLVGALLPGANETTPSATADGGAWDGTKVALALVILLTTPLQAVGEELVFRGYLMQAIGAVTGTRFGSAVAVVGTALVFALAHGAQNPPLFVDRFAFGLLAGYLVVRTGGLEAGIALHVLNNIVAFGLALAVGDVTESLTVSSVPWSNIVVTVVQNGLYLVLVLAVFRRLGLVDRTTRAATVTA
ncbi:hypothetical protein GCM10011519_11190 [Marmoricola endophyticus]|uniref:CAAX prenyl protease 2/Lysostaphin resistance protein A-like domain-containing protein n=1 Tax=Marmoricola endophyticus TaxID=2040280 RepID=A0A917BHG6_9ACTN|nr:CPBP family intramembrane glutamic endopeptidase [Marmoricola endophyticus]GGF39298.1 hypothetical protein GCM10011519_11190 [Marmoricola endophyticus]